MKQNANKKEIFLTGPHFGILNLIKSFLAILYPMKTTNAFWFPGVFRRYKIGTLARNGSI